MNNPNDAVEVGSVASLMELNMDCHGSVIYSGSDGALLPVDRNALGKDQRQGYDIIVWHLDQVLKGRSPLPLRMILYGKGGTGKSKVIQTVTEAFKAKGCLFMLIKTAYTGVVASLIDGKTTHVIGGISSFGDKRALTAEAKSKLQAFWKHKRYIILDEYSMIAKDFFGLLSRNISIGKGASIEDAHSQSFGGLNVIICGDLHQFPPVARSQSSALYYPSDPMRDSIESQLGHAIYEEFSTMVILKEQMRAMDKIWHEFLQHL